MHLFYTKIKKKSKWSSNKLWMKKYSGLDVSLISDLNLCFSWNSMCWCTCICMSYGKLASSLSFDNRDDPLQWTALKNWNLIYIINQTIDKPIKKERYLVVFQCSSSLYSWGHRTYWHATLKISSSEFRACLNIYFHVHGVSKTKCCRGKNRHILNHYEYLPLYCLHSVLNLSVLYHAGLIFSDGFMFRKQTNVIVVTSLTTGQ